MVIIMNPDATQQNINDVIEVIKDVGLEARVTEGVQQKIVAVIGDKSKLMPVPIDAMTGVDHCVAISKSYKLASRESHPQSSIIDVDGVKIGGSEPIIMAGPCAVESREQLLESAEIIKSGGAQFLRGGAYKPRTSPYSFQGLEEEGLKYLAEAREKTGLKIVTEVTTVEAIEKVAYYADMLQIGARNMQNFELLKEVGKSTLPVLLKRGMSATIDEWLNAAEYIMSEGNPHIALCERGIRTFETATRNTLDLSAVLVLKERTHLPVIVDPSHATGVRSYVSPLAKAAVAAGADGLMIEVHNDPEHALSDGPQSLTFEQFDETMRDLAPYLELGHRKLG